MKSLYNNRISVVRSHSFSVDKLNDIGILSALDDKILIGKFFHSELFVYYRKVNRLETITINETDLYDASWTPNGNVVYTTLNSNKVTVITENGTILAHSQMRITAVCCLSISSDGMIYLAVSQAGVYQSTNDGFSWTLVFKIVDGWYCWHALKVITENSTDFLTLEWYGRNRQETFSMSKRSSDGTLKWKVTNFATGNGIQIVLSKDNRISYDDSFNIFVSDNINKAVHEFSLDGQYKNLLLPSSRIQKIPFTLSVDSKNCLLAVGENFGFVEVFEIKYGITMRNYTKK